MTAASAYPPGPDQGSAEGRAAEPSMEDILASIRRIIADDQQSNGTRRRAQPAAPPVAAPPPPPPEEPARRDHDDVLDLAHYARGVDAPAETGHSFASDPQRGAEHQAPPPADFAPEPPAGPVGDGAGHVGHGTDDAYDSPESYEAGEEQRNLALLAPPMSESVMSAFEALAATVVLENKPMLEGILRDLLRPMLKAWLDDNLPALVERLVRIEIERVARGGRH